MTVKVGNTMLIPRQISGGCPQGSILGIFLFNVTTDDLDEDSEYISNVARPEVAEEDMDFHNARPDPEPEVFPELSFGNVGPHDLSTGDSDSRDDPSAFYSALETADGEELPASSSPLSELPPFDLSASPILDAEVMDFRLGPRDVDPRARPIIYSSEGDLTLPPEPTSTCLGPWRARPVDVDKYVNDDLQEEAVNFENAPETEDLAGKKHQNKACRPFPECILTYCQKSRSKRNESQHNEDKSSFFQSC